jgi:hypothetical protein
VSFTRRSLYPQGKNPSYPVDRSLGGAQNRSRRGGEKKNSQLLPRFELPVIQPVVQRYTTELSRLLCRCRMSTQVSELMIILLLGSSCVLRVSYFPAAVRLCFCGGVGAHCSIAVLYPPSAPNSPTPSLLLLSGWFL